MGSYLQTTHGTRTGTRNRQTNSIELELELDLDKQFATKSGSRTTQINSLEWLELKLELHKMNERTGLMGRVLAMFL